MSIKPAQSGYVGAKDDRRPGLSRDTVREWAAAMDLPVSEDSLDDLTSRVDRTLRSITRADDLPLDDIEPDYLSSRPRLSIAQSQLEQNSGHRDCRYSDNKTKICGNQSLRYPCR